MARIYKLLYVLCLVFKEVTSFLTIGWVDGDLLPSALCHPDTQLSITTDYIKLYNTKEVITTPCYCSISPRDENTTTLQWAVIIISVYDETEERFDTWLTLSGASEWGVQGNRDSLYFETTVGDNATIYIPHLQKGLPLNTTIYITTVNATVHMTCSTEPFIIPTEDDTAIVLNATTMQDKTAADAWYNNTRIRIIAACVALTLFVTVVVLVILIVCKRRRKKPDVALDWRHPGVVATEGSSHATAGPATGVDTFADVDGNNGTDVTASLKSSSATKHSLLLDNSCEKGGLVEEKVKGRSADEKIKHNTPEATTSPQSGVTYEINTKPDLLKRGIYDNVMQSNRSPDTSDSYIHPEKKIAKSTDSDFEAKEKGNEFHKGIDEIPEYAEIEEMQMLLRKPLGSKTGTNNSNATSASDASGKGNQTPRKKFKMFGRKKDKDKKKEMKSKTKEEEPLKDKENAKQKDGGKSEEIKLTDLDFSQLKDAIDKMDPQEVKDTMKQVSESPSLGKKDIAVVATPGEHIYTNTPPQKPPRLAGSDHSQAKSGPQSSTLGIKQDDLVKYDSPRNSQKDPEKGSILQSIKRPKLNIPLETATKTPQVEPSHPVSPRSKWGTPVHVSELYSKPEKPSKLPRPTSPTPHSPTTGLDAYQNKAPVKQTPWYHVPKVTSSSSAFTPVPHAEKPSLFSPSPLTSKPNVSNSTSSPFFKSPTSPTSPSSLKSLGLVVKATEALQSPTKSTNHTRHIGPTSSAFSSAFNRFKEKNAESSASCQENAATKGVGSPNRNFSEKTRESSANNKGLSLSSVLNSPYDKSNAKPIEVLPNHQNKSTSTGINSNFNRFKPITSQPTSGYHNKPSVTRTGSSYEKPKLSTEPSSDKVGYKPPSWARPASPKLDSPRQGLQVRSQFRK